MVVSHTQVTRTAPAQYTADASTLGVRPGVPFPERLVVIGPNGKAYAFEWVTARHQGVGGPLEAVEYARKGATLLVFND